MNLEPHIENSQTVNTPIPYNLENFLLDHIKGSKSDFIFVLNILLLYGFNVRNIPGLYNSEGKLVDLETAKNKLSIWLMQENGEDAPQYWSEGHRLGDFRHDEEAKKCYVTSIPVIENMDITDSFIFSDGNENFLYGNGRVNFNKNYNNGNFNIPSKSFKTHLDAVCYKIRITQENKLYINSIDGVNVDTLDTTTATYLKPIKEIISKLQATGANGEELPKPDLADTYINQLILRDVNFFNASTVIYIPTAQELDKFVPRTAVYTIDNILTNNVIRDYGGCFYVIVQSDPVKIPEYTEDGENIYVDSMGMRTTKASYSNTFLTHQAAIRATFNKMIKNDNWMYRLPEGKLSLIQVGDKTQLKAYTRYCVSTQYKLLNSLPNENISASDAVIPYKIVKNLTTQAYTEVKNETFKKEFNYSYIDSDRPVYKCYVDSPLNIPIIGGRIYSPQLENEPSNSKGRNVILNFYTRTISPLLNYSSGFSQQKAYNSVLRIDKEDKIIFQFCIANQVASSSGYPYNKFTKISTIETTIFNARGKYPYLLLGITSNKETLTSYIGKYFSFRFGESWFSGQIKGSSLDITQTRLTIPELSHEDLKFYLGTELGFDSDKIKELFGDDAENVYFLKIPLGTMKEKLVASYICQISGSDGTIVGGSIWE